MPVGYRAGFWGWPPEAVAAPSETLPDVVVIFVDTLRADHMQAYGYERDTMPQVEEFFRDGVRFEQASVHVPLTGPSAISLMTGRNDEERLRFARHIQYADWTLEKMARKLRTRHPEALFVFVNRRRDRIKLLYHDNTGLWVATKRLETGRYSWPRATASGEKKIKLTPEALQLVLDGVDLRGATFKPWYQRAD